MRKIIFAITILCIFFSTRSFAAEEVTLLEFRVRIFDESKAIKQLLNNSQKDMIFMNSMWDSCIFTMTQLDAYFAMIGVVNTIRKDSVTEEAVTYLSDWLKVIKNANQMNIQNLNIIASRQIAAATKVRVQRLIKYYDELNKRLDVEQKGVLALKTTAKKR